MPKLNATHIPERLREAIEQLERGEEVEAKKNKSLLNVHQQKALDDAWTEQQVLRKKHKPPKSEEEKQKLGWKDKREVRIEIYKQALQDADGNAVEDIKELQKQREARANRIYMDAWSKSVSEGKGGTQAVSAGNIALVKAGFGRAVAVVNERDKEIHKLERQILERAEDRLSEEEREHLEWLRGGKKPVKKPKKV
ncbi:hypothetical protein ICN18_02530 [Polynucleobacter sp. Ross1-W9]|uniref:hypothetical protein n=1 Tax=Polynucleobacter parvulilacunae TaxID=1855631 RepID=UPI001C0B04C5|nr:hypothetical protein [Polynucleobacter parvulilacunae]MBU3556504.1 hypothetical protein [Polynucleobacter parvulilacunae]